MHFRHFVNNTIKIKNVYIACIYRIDSWVNKLDMSNYSYIVYSFEKCIVLIFI